MKTLSEQLTQYALYHRDPRNIATHFIGIPMIVFAVAVLLSRPVLVVSGLELSPATVVVVLSCLYYLKLDLIMGVLMTLLFGSALYGAASLAALPTSEWLMWGIGLFVVGWVFQFVGHFYEGKKPAFVDDISGLIIGPLFVACELLFLLGACSALKNEVEKGAGVVAIRQGKKAEA